MFKVLALREKFAHMSSVSGYDVLYSHFPDDVEIDSIFCNFKKIYPRGIGRLLKTAAGYVNDSLFYNSQSLEAELKLVAKAIPGKYNIIHYSYGEPYFSLGSLLKKESTFVVITNHQPVSWWQQNKTLLKKHAKADLIIALSAHDAAYFNSHLPGKAVCIPHGVDINFFKPRLAVKKQNQETFNIIFTGRYLRDMEILAAVIKKLSATYKNFYFDIVYLDKKEVSEPYLNEIMQLPNVGWHADIADDALLSLYQQADCCLIPLIDCTANNAILEAMACGLPVISTNLPAITTYLDDSMSVLGRPGSADDLCDALLILYQNPDKRNEMALKARQKAENQFDWTIIAGQTSTLFKSL